jgi:hypothetical protein
VGSVIGVMRIWRVLGVGEVDMRVDPGGGSWSFVESSWVIDGE